MIIRVAAPADAATLAGMLHDFNREFGEPTPGPAVLAPRVRSLIESDAKTYLLGGEGPDAFAQLAFIPSVWADQPVAHLDELYVRPPRRGRGIGRAIMNAAIELARARGVAGMEVVTGEDDNAARRLYESLGFRNQIEGPDNTRALFYELEM